MADPLTARLHTATTWSIAVSILMIAAGLAAIALPFVAAVAVTAFVGWLLVFSGVMHVAFAWRSRTAGMAILEVLLGIVYGVIGFYLVTRPLVGLVSLTLALAIYLFAEAVLEVVLALQSRAAARGWLLFDGVVTFILALLIAANWPLNSVWVLGTLVGISMLFSGVSRLMLSLALRRVVR